MRRLLALLPAALAVACWLAPARADVDVTVANGQKVHGTLDPVDEVETLSCRIPAGALLSVAVKGKKQRGGAPAPAVTFRVLDEADTEVSAGRVRTKGVGAKLKKLPIDTTGVYRVVIDAAAVGDYLANVKWKSRKSWQETVELTGAAATLGFSVDAGATCSFQAKASRKSAAEPVLDRVELAESGSVYEFAPPAAGAVKHTEKGVALEDFGDHTLVVDANAGGEASVRIVAKAPKPDRRTTIAITAKEVGSGNATGKVIGPLGGNVSVGEDGPIAGAAVDVPPGALSRPTAIIVGEGLALGLEGLEATGPGVYFGPEGLSFSTDATITIPFDPLSVNEAADVQVAVRDARGNVTLVDPADYEVDMSTGIITVHVAHFSTYQAFRSSAVRVLPRKGDLNGDRISDIVVPSGSNNANAIHRNQLQVFLGRWRMNPGTLSTSSDVDMLFQGTGADDDFGRVFVVADVSGDGQDDLIVSDPEVNDRDGAVYIFFGGRSFQGSLDPSADADVTISGVPGVREALGRSLAVGNLMGSSRNELIISGGRIPGQDDEKKAAYVFEGPITQDAVATDATVIIVGEEDADLDVRGCGNLTGDSYDELVLVKGGAPPLGLFVFEGGTTFSSRVDPVIGDADVFIGNHSSSWEDLGRFCLFADVGGDAYDDLIATAPSSFGFVYVFFGSASFDPGRADNADAEFRPSPSQNHFLRRLIAPNLDRVGKAELVLPDHVNDQRGGDQGSAFVYRSADLAGTRTPMDDAFHRIDGTESSAQFGTWAASGDINADGLEDMWFAAPLASLAPGDPTGAVYVYFGRSPVSSLPTTDTGADITIVGQPGEYLGNLQFSNAPN